jgi:hypothetical protein
MLAQHSPCLGPGMDLKKLPPSLLVVLGLGCARTQPPTVGPCLSPPYDPSTQDAGPCLSPAQDTTPTDPDPDPDDADPDTDAGDVPPCLSPPMPQATTATSSATATSRREALDRVLARAALPADVAARLREPSRRG